MLARPPRLITSTEAFLRHLDTLRVGDCVSCRLGLRPSEESLLVDLVERGIVLFPSATAQAAARSKTLQARLFASWMVPGTAAIHDPHQLMDYLHSAGHAHTGGRVVTKADRRNAGLGVHLWDHLEAVYTQASLGGLPFPFVVQPFVSARADLRVVVLGDYVEAYQRQNTRNFRHNLHFGGQSQPWTMSPALESTCREIMARGGFPYAHLDFLLAEDGQTHLSEINLRGGIRGAAISPDQYRRRIEELHRKFAEDQGFSMEPARLA